MVFIKKYLSLLILIAIVYSGYFFTHLPTATKPLHVLGASTNLTLFQEPDNGRQFLLDAINSATKEIFVEVYLLSDKQIISALEDARTRGIDVKVMLEEHPFGGGTLNQKTDKELTLKGVAVAWSNPDFALTHEKAMVIDGNQAFILSQNLTASAFVKNREYDIYDTNPQDVLEVRDIFIHDWERNTFIPPKNTNLIESPDTSRTIITTLITSATNSIDADAEDIDDSQIISLLSEKAKTIKVRLLVPTLSQIASNKHALDKLTSEGVEVETIASPYMHAKMVLVDSTKAYVGSINFSTQSLDKNRELGIIITQLDIVDTLSNTFEMDWTHGKEYTN